MSFRWVHRRVAFGNVFSAQHRDKQFRKACGRFVPVYLTGKMIISVRELLLFSRLLPERNDAHTHKPIIPKGLEL